MNWKNPVVLPRYCSQSLSLYSLPMTKLEMTTRRVGDNVEVDVMINHSATFFNSLILKTHDGQAVGLCQNGLTTISRCWVKLADSSARSLLSMVWPWPYGDGIRTQSTFPLLGRVREVDMIRLILLTDFTETFPHNMLRGIPRLPVNSRMNHGWHVACRPRSKTNMVSMACWNGQKIGAQTPSSDVLIMMRMSPLFAKNGIVALAQDFKQRFTVIPISPVIISKRVIWRQILSRQGVQKFRLLWLPEYGLVWRTVWWIFQMYQSGWVWWAFPFLQTSNSILYGFMIPQHLWIGWSPCLLTRHYSVVMTIRAIKSRKCATLVGSCIPDDVAVLGVDNDVTVCNLSAPTLSSVNLDIERGGYDAAALIVQMMAHPDTPLTDVVIQPTTIVSRSSTNIYATDDPYILKALEYIHGNLYVPSTWLMYSDNYLYHGDYLKFDSEKLSVSQYIIIYPNAAWNFLRDYWEGIALFVKSHSI